MPGDQLANDEDHDHRTYEERHDSERRAFAMPDVT